MLSHCALKFSLPSWEKKSVFHPSALTTNPLPLTPYPSPLTTPQPLALSLQLSPLSSQPTPSALPPDPSSISPQPSPSALTSQPSFLTSNIQSTTMRQSTTIWPYDNVLLSRKLTQEASTHCFFHTKLNKMEKVLSFEMNPALIRQAATPLKTTGWW